MKCMKCGKETIEEDTLVAGPSVINRVYLVHGEVELIAYLCLSCGHIELGFDTEKYREVQLKYMSEKIRKYIHQERNWTLSPTEFEMTLSDLADEVEVEPNVLSTMIDGVIERLNDPDYFWKRRYEGPKDGIQFEIKGTGKGAKIIVKDTRPPREPLPERF